MLSPFLGSKTRFKPLAFCAQVAWCWWCRRLPLSLVGGSKGIQCARGGCKEAFPPIRLLSLEAVEHNRSRNNVAVAISSAQVEVSMMTDEQIPFEFPDLVSNPEPRCPCLLLLDTSGSMSGRPLAELNEGGARL